MTYNYFTIEKQAVSQTRAPVLFAIVANERYFLPHFFRHYRRLGVKTFYVLVDDSTDGTQEFLMEQDDCTVLSSPHCFGDKVHIEVDHGTYSGRFANVARVAIPKALAMGQWCVIADADEFLVLPAPYRTLPAFIRELERLQLTCCRALMIDFFPEKLADIPKGDIDASPFALNPYYDRLGVDWPDGQAEPSTVDHSANVRSRIVEQLAKLMPSRSQTLQAGKPELLYKCPLIKLAWNTQMPHAHICNHTVRNMAQLAIAHFKFYPGWEDKVAGAMTKKQYSRGSIKYVPLALAISRRDKLILPTHESCRHDSMPLAKSDMVFLHSYPAAKVKQPRTAARQLRWEEPNRNGLEPLHIGTHGDRHSTVTGVAWLDEHRLVANHRNGLRIALFDIRRSSQPILTAELPNLTDNVAVKPVNQDVWELTVSDCWAAAYTQLRLDVRKEPSFTLLYTHWFNRRSFCHGVSYDLSGALWLAFSTGAYPRIEQAGKRAWRLPKPWGARYVCFDPLSGDAYAISNAKQPTTAAYEETQMRVFKLAHGNDVWMPFTTVKEVHSDCAAVYAGRLWVNDQHGDRVVGISLDPADKSTRIIKTPLLSFPHGVAVSNDGQMAVANYGNSTITVFDLNRVLVDAT